MHIERHGTGPAHILGIHGWSGDRHTFDPVVVDLPAGFTFWTLDLPGCGLSAPPATWTLQSVLSELAEVVHNLPSPPHIVGNCSGALFALEAAKCVPVARVTLIDAFAWWPWYFRVFLAPGWGRYAYATAFANPVGRWLANASLARRRAADTSLTDGFTRVDHAVTYRYLEMLSEIQNPERFRGILSAIDVLYGERSFAAVRDSVRRWQQIFPHARATMLLGAGHLPILESTAQVRKELFREISCPFSQPPLSQTRPKNFAR